MKKLFSFISCLFLIANTAFAIEEVTLETDENNFFDKLSNIYYGKVENYSEVSPVVKLFSQKGLEFDNSFVNSVKLSMFAEGNLILNATDKATQNFLIDFPILEPMVTAKFNENKDEIMFDINFARHINCYTNRFTEKISRAYISHSFNENQKILIGQGARVPVNYEGSVSTMAIDLIMCAQIGRNLGNVASLGIRNIASYKYLDYDIGVYDSTRYMADLGNGSEFTGYVMLKPFASLDDKLNSFRLGGGYNIGESVRSYHQYSVFSSYDYDKFHIRAEYANADRCNGIKFINDNSDGFYTTAIFDITPKVSIVGRYDFFTPNTNHNNNYTQEYTGGITYKPFKNMKVMLNYVRTNQSNLPDSNMFIFATRFII